MDGSDPDPMPYVCPICGQKFEGNSTLEQLLTKDSFWIRYSAQLVNHTRKTHMPEVSESIIKGKEKGKMTDYRELMPFNNKAKIIIIEELKKKMPKSIALNVLEGMYHLKDNNDHFKETISKEVEALKEAYR